MTLDIIAFFAHPDDETMLCGGTLALYSQLGARVHVLIATRGEGGEMGNPPLCEREALGALRENELRCAIQALGLADLTLLDYVDPTVGPGETLFPYTENLDGLTAQVTAEIQRWNAVAILSHGINGEYGHPAHKLSHQAVQRAVQTLADGSPTGTVAPLFYTVAASFAEHPYPRLTNADEPAHLIIDVEPILQQKTAAALCHRTQHDLFIRHRSEEAGRRLSVPEIILPVESLHRVWPPVPQGEAPEDVLADLLLASGYARLVETPTSGG